MADHGLITALIKKNLKKIRLGLRTTLTSEDKNGDFETSLKVKNKDYILMYNGLGAKIDNISTNEVVYPINHFYAL